METTQTADALQTELSTLQARREQIASEAEQAKTELDTARQSVVEGTGKSASLVAAQSKHDAISGALSAIDGKIANLQQRLTEARAAEARAAKEQRRAELARIEDEQGKEMAAIGQEMNAAIEPLVDRYIAAMTARNKAQRESREIGIELGLINPNAYDSTDDRQRSISIPGPNGRELAVVVQAVINRADNENRRQMIAEAGRRNYEHEMATRAKVALR